MDSRCYWNGSLCFSLPLRESIIRDTIRPRIDEAGLGYGMRWFVYLLFKDGRPFYVGYTGNLPFRVLTHMQRHFADGEECNVTAWLFGPRWTAMRFERHLLLTGPRALSNQTLRKNREESGGDDDWFRTAIDGWSPVEQRARPRRRLNANR